MKFYCVSFGRCKKHVHDLAAAGEAVSVTSAGLAVGPGRQRRRNTHPMAVVKQRNRRCMELKKLSKRCAIFTLAVCGNHFLLTLPGLASVLESPANGATLSGIGFISGWKCDAKNITVKLDDGGHVPVALGQPRADTRLICGTVENGFITQVNWNFLKDGEHTAIAYEAGKEFARSTFTVVTAGVEFLRVGNQPLTTQCEVRDFPSMGETSRLVWEESTQHFELAEIVVSTTEPQDPPTVPEESTLAQVCPEWTTTDIGNVSASHMQECLDAGGNHTATVNGFSILRHLVSNNNEDAARVLLEAGADPNAFSSEFEPVLHHALSEWGSVEMVALLLKHGADPNLSASYTYNPPFRVLFSNWLGHWEDDVLVIIDLLLEAGARIHLEDSIPTSTQNMPLHYAVLVTLYLTREDGRLSPETLEHVRAVILRLLEAGADINAQRRIPHQESVQGYRLGRTALHYALQDRATFRGGTEIVELLLEQGADPNVATSTIQTVREEGTYATQYRRIAVPHHTALHHIMNITYWSDHLSLSLSLVQLLLDAGADPNLGDADGRNSLFYLSRVQTTDEREEIERALVQAGAVPNETYECHTQECVEAWVSANGNDEQENNEGE